MNKRNKRKIKELAEVIQEVIQKEKITLNHESSEILKKAINNPEDLTEVDINKVWNDIDKRYPGDKSTPAQLTMAAYRIVNLFGDIKAILNK